MNDSTHASHTLPASAGQLKKKPVARLIALLPPGPGVQLMNYRPVLRAAEEARYYREQSKTELVSEVILSHAADIGAECVELLGPKVRLEMPCKVRLPCFVIHMKDTGRFCGVEIGLVDASGKTFSLLANNKTSSIRIQNSSCSMPLEIGQGWNIIRLDLPDIMKRAFGPSAEYSFCSGVVIHASVAVARCYFESQPLEDFELPEFLRTFK